MSKTFSKLLAAFAAVLMGVPAFSQVTTSALSGSVVDDSGAPVIGAAVIATHVPSGTSYAAVTNANGRYSINGMRSGGPYSVEVSSLGYQTITYTDVTLSLAEVYSLNATVKEDKQMLSEAVVVAAPSSKFSTEKTGAATNITSSQMNNLPTVSRSITDITKLSPYGGNGMSFAGTDGRTANFTVDGANFNNNFGLSSNLPGGGNPISIDAIEELQVVISPYDVRQSNFIGGGVNAITKSGTNKFKGTAYVYHRNENMRGDSVDGEAISGARDKDRKTTYGFTLGGPIVPNRLFFFFNYEEAKIPTVVNRWRGSENGVADPDNYISRTSLADLEKVSKFVKDKYGYDTGSWTNYPADELNRKILARLDWNINKANHLAVRYNYTLNQGWNSTNATSMDGGTRYANGRMSKASMAFANSMYSMDNLVHSVSVDLNSRISNSVSNQFLATFSKLDDIRGSNSSDFPMVDIAKDGDNYMSLGYELFTWNNGVHNNVFNAKDDLTWYKGNHKATFGLSYEYQMADNSYMRSGTGYYRYSSLDDFLNSAAPEVVCLTYGYDGEANPAATVRFHKLAAYAQDEWNINTKLKLTYGLRLESIVFDNDDLMTNNAIKDLDYFGTHIDTGKWPGTKVQFSPRIGVNWDVFGDKSLKVRGGTGLFTGRLPLVFFTNMPTNGGMVQYQAKIGPSNDKMDMSTFAGGVLRREDLLKKLISLGYPETISPDKGTLPSSVNAVDPKFKMPQVWKTSIAVDYQIPVDFPFTVGAEFIFNKTVNGVNMKDISLKPVEGYARLNGADNRPMFPADYRSASVKPAYVLKNTNKGYGSSLSFTLNMTPVKGLNLNAAYTHTVSKELTGMPGSDATSAFTYVPTYTGPNKLPLHNSQYVTPDRFFANLSYNAKNDHFSVFYETWRGGSNYSYMMVNDMNGDGYQYDALYIPTDEQVAKNQFRFKSDSDRERFMAFVHKDHYLKNHQGQYAEGYSVYTPWVHRVDLRYAHDFRVKIGKTTNVLQVSVDMKNLMNLFNSKWGVSKTMLSDLNSGRILKYETTDADGYAVFSTPSALGKEAPKTWQLSHAIGQCWYAQIGLKYMFN